MNHEISLKQIKSRIRSGFTSHSELNLRFLKILKLMSIQQFECEDARPNFLESFPFLASDGSLMPSVAQFLFFIDFHNKLFTSRQFGNACVIDERVYIILHAFVPRISNDLLSGVNRQADYFFSYNDTETEFLVFFPYRLSVIDLCFVITSSRIPVTQFDTGRKTETLSRLLL
jgi:hypothetical protein